MTDQPLHLGKYQILTPLGQGGFGVVYQARDLALERTVALKVLAPHLLADPAFAAQFSQEARLAARLSHPHIVTVYDVGQDEGRHYIAMQFIDGPSLDKRMARGEPWPLERILALAGQVAEALDYAHREGVLHLDIKPGNILLAGDGHAWLTDFGLGRASSPVTQAVTLPSLGGTPAYLAPEQADLENARPITAAADLYAFAVLLYDLCTGHLPFSGAPTAVLNAHVNQQPPRPSLLNPSLSQGVEEVLLRGLAKSPQARYPDAAGLALSLAEAVQAGPARPAVRRVMAVEPFILGDLRVRNLRELVQACDAAWPEAVERLYDGSLEQWLERARILAAAEEAQRIRKAHAKAQGRKRERGLEEFLQWTGYATEPLLAVTPEEVDFGADEKGYGYRLAAPLTVQNAGRGLLWGQVEAQAPWLAVAEGAEFAVRPGERHDVLVEADVDRLPAGQTVEPAALAVRAQVGDSHAGARIEVWGPTPVISPPELDFGEVAAGQEPVRTLTLANHSRGAWEGTISVDVPWLAVTPQRFRCTAGRQQVVQVKVHHLPRLGRELKGAVLLDTNEGIRKVRVQLVNMAGFLLPGFELVRIPSGEFLFGEDKRKIYLPEYWVSKTPVTNAQYAVFIHVTGYPPPGHWQGDCVPTAKENHPVVNVSWEDAQRFCQWVGLRLPTEQEWEKAARGMDGREYPWGNQAPDAQRCNFNQNVKDTTPVGKYPAGASPYGLLDMAGNVWEWCEGWKDAQDDTRVLRGGSWTITANDVRAAGRLRYPPVIRGGNDGFRCAGS